jgi:glucokinase
MRQAATAIGIDVGGTNLRAARVSDAGIILDRVTEKIPPNADAVVARIAELVRQFDRPDVAAIGIGVPGRVDARRRLVLSGGYINLAGAPLVQSVEQSAGRLVVLDNDCNMALIAEIAVGAAQSQSNVVMFTIGTGIGGAVVLDGEIVRGRRSAGQLGHLTVDLNGALCACGRSGCVETTSSGAALRRHIAAANLPADSGIEQLFALDSAGDSSAARVLDSWARPLRAAIDSAVAAFDPDLVLLGGGLGLAASLALARAPALAPWYQCAVEPARLGDDAGVIGAALTALRQAQPR